MAKTPLVAAAGLALLGIAYGPSPVAIADAVGGPCDDWMKIGVDSDSGNQMFCAHSRAADPNSQLSWQPWGAHLDSLPQVGSVGSPCPASEYTVGRSEDGYVAWCLGGTWRPYSPADSP